MDESGQERRRYQSDWAAVFFALLLAGSMWFYVQRIVIPFQISEAIAHDHPRGNLSDLYPRWLGARELLLHGRDPYSATITREIQAGYYGRAVDPGRPGDPSDLQAFAYPVYVVFLLAPVIHFPFTVIQRWFYWSLILLLCINVILWMRLLKWKMSLPQIAVVVLFTLSSIAAIQGIKLQQFSLVVSAIIAVSAMLLVKGRFVPASILLAVATIKPQLVLPAVAWLSLWVSADWRKRQGFLWGFAGTLSVLFAASEYILPGWFGEFTRAIVAYRDYTNAASTFDYLTGPKIGLVLTIILIGFTATICWTLRRFPETSDEFVFALALVLAVTLVIIPTLSTYNQVLMLPGILVLVHKRRSLWNRNKAARVAWATATLALFWPWFAALGLLLALFVFPSAIVQQYWALPFYTSIVAPLGVLGLLFQYALQVWPASNLSDSAK